MSYKYFHKKNLIKKLGMWRENEMEFYLKSHGLWVGAHWEIYSFTYKKADQPLIKWLLD